MNEHIDLLGALNQASMLTSCVPKERASTAVCNAVKCGTVSDRSSFQTWRIMEDDLHMVRSVSEDVCKVQLRAESFGDSFGDL